MRGELIPLSKDPSRPAILKHDGWVVYLSVHDQAYMHQLRSWKRKLKAVHPDARGRKSWEFRVVMKQRKLWQIAEAQWYAQLGLLPPDGFAHAGVKVEQRLRLIAAKQSRI